MRIWTLIGKGSDIDEEFIEEEVAECADDPTEKFCTSLVEREPLNQQDEDQGLYNDIKQCEETISYKVVCAFVVFFEHEVLVEKERTEETQSVSDDIRCDVVRTEPDQEKVTAEVNNNRRPTAHEVEQKLPCMCLDELLQEPNERVFREPGHVFRL